MPDLSVLTRASVLEAIAEFDGVGRDAFLERNGFKEAREYFLIYNGHRYDSKAIAGVAYGKVTGTPLASADFTGGMKTVEALEDLGFDVVGISDWTWPELVLAGALLATHGWHRTLRANETPVRELSNLLRDRSPRQAILPEFRSPSSVQRKLEDFRTADPQYAGATTRGGKLTAQVARAFLDDPEQMLTLARLLRESPKLFEDKGFDDDDTAVIDEPESRVTAAIEGRIARRFVISRERDPRLRAEKLRQVDESGLPRACEVCRFDFQKVYGPHGEGYIQVHHVVPLHVSGVVTTRPEDLVLLCANCHVMIHRGEWKTPDELRAILASR